MVSQLSGMSAFREKKKQFHFDYYSWHQQFIANIFATLAYEICVNDQITTLLGKWSLKENMLNPDNNLAHSTYRNLV